MTSVEELQWNEGRRAGCSQLREMGIALRIAPSSRLVHFPSTALLRLLAALEYGLQIRE